MGNQVARESILTLEIGMRDKPGFTLIEILIVIVIIGVTLGFALLAFGDFGGDRRVLVAAEEFAHYLRLIQQQAIIQYTTLGVKVNSSNYQVLRLSSKDQWKAMPKRSIYKIHDFPKHAKIQFYSYTPQQNPNIIMSSSGDMSPFEVDFLSEKNKILAVIKGYDDGSITFKSTTAP